MEIKDGLIAIPILLGGSNKPYKSLSHNVKHIIMYIFSYFCSENGHCLKLEMIVCAS